MNRRSFLKSIGIGLGATAVGVTVAIQGFSRYGPVVPTIFSPPDEFSGNGWLHIGVDGRCTFLSPRAEMGQHAALALAQIVAEELMMSVEQIDIHLPSTIDVEPQMMTSGSFSMLMYARPVARAAAALREALREKAQAVFNVSDISLEQGGTFVANDGLQVSFAELAGKYDLDVDVKHYSDVPLYSFELSRVPSQIGRSALNPFAREMVKGSYPYVHDIVLPNMLHGYVVRPPVVSARLLAFDENAAKAVAGFRQLIVDRDTDFIGVVASSTYSAWQSAKALAVEWEYGEQPTTKALEALVDVDREQLSGFKRAIHEDELDINQDWDVDLRFEVQVQSHAQQEPRAAIAHVAPDSAELWAANQDIFVIQRQAAKELGLEVDAVKVNAFMMGGAFGGREHYDVEADAVRLSRVAGVPIKVQWTREDEFRLARNRPPSSHRVRASANGDGKLVNFWHCYVSGKHFYTRARFSEWGLKLLDFSGDFGAMNSADMPYEVDKKRIELSDIDLPVRTGTWRSLGAAPNIFASDCALDELAYAVGQKPLAFKRKNISAAFPRLANCLGRVQHWMLENPLAKPAESDSGNFVYGRGCAAGIYSDKSFIAINADVRVDLTSRAIKVTRVFCCQDVGMAINPDGLTAQLESNVIWGVGMALIEKVQFDGAGVANLNFDGYPVPRMADSPAIEVEIVSDRSQPPAGAGETGILVVPAAIANAVRNATGQRLTRLPLSLNS